MNKKDYVIGVHGGHAEIGSRGAKGFIDEVDCDRIVADEIVTYLMKKGYNAVDISVYEGSQQEVLDELKKRSFNWHTTHNISIHFNAWTTEGANGFEVYYNGDLRKANRLCEKFCRLIPLQNRHAKSGTHLFVCNNLRDCILIEMGFVTSPYDSQLYNNEKRLRSKARKIAKLYIKEWLNC